MSTLPASSATQTLTQAHAWQLSVSPRVACAALIGLIAVVYALALRPGHPWGDDFSMYILQAKNIAQGQPYADTKYIYNPENAVLGPPSYPPVASVLLAPVYRVTGLDLVAFKLVMVGSILAALACCAACFYQRLAPLHLVLALALIGLNGYFLIDANGVGSDAPFLMFLYLTLWLMDRLYREAPRTRPGLIAAATLGATIYLCFGTRTVGIVLVPTLWTLDLLRYRRPSRAAVVATGVFAALALVQSAVSGRREGGYLDQLTPDPLLLAGHAWQYALRMVAFWSNGYSKALAGGVFLAFTGLAVLGYAQSVRQRISALDVFPIFYIAVILVFPAYQGERFLFPVLPLYVYYAVKGLEHPWFAARPAARWLEPVLIVAALTTYIARYTTLDFGPIAEGPHRQESVELFDYLSAHTSPQDVILFGKPRALALYADRPAAAYQSGVSDEQLWKYIRQTGARYVVSFVNNRPLDYADDWAMAETLRQFIAHNGAQLTPVYANADFQVYQIHPPREGVERPHAAREFNSRGPNLGRLKADYLHSLHLPSEA